jgi:hypothetical protein
MAITRPGRTYPRRLKWKQIRAECAKPTCEVTGVPLYVPSEDPEKLVYIGALDHICPERFLRRFAPGLDPHLPLNLITVCSSLHAKKRRAEDALFRSDLLTFRGELNRLEYPMERVDEALRFYGLMR